MDSRRPEQLGARQHYLPGVIMDLRTWEDGPVAVSDMDTITSELLYLTQTPACSRVSVQSPQVADGTWAFVPLAAPGTGAGQSFSWDTTGRMGSHPTRITAPTDGLYEVTWTVVIRHTSTGALTYAQAAVGTNPSVATDVASLPDSRGGLGRTGLRERAGSGSATVPLRAGDYVSLGAIGHGATWTVGTDETGRWATRLTVRWVGEYVSA